MSLQEAYAAVAPLSKAEKAELVQWMIQELADAFPGIEKDPAIMGGEARIARTRIPVWLLVSLRKLGSSDGELLQFYPTLQAQHLAHAWAYAEAHQEEIECNIREQEEAE